MHSTFRPRRFLPSAIALTLTAVVIGGDAFLPRTVAQPLPPIDQIREPAPDDPTADADTSDDRPADVVFVDEVAAKAFAPPPEAKRLSKTSNLWIDRERHRVYVDGYVALDRGMLEMFACPSGTKEHESVLGLLAKSKEVHAALLAIGAKPGTVVAYEPNFLPPTGQQIRIWVCWRDDEGRFKVVDARQLIRNIKTKQVLKEDWVFAGSKVWTDPVDGTRYYQADGGDMVCVSNFSTAMLDVPFESSAQAGDLLFEPFADNLPKRDTPVRVVMTPIPVPTDEPEARPNWDPDQKPDEKILPPAETKADASQAGSTPPDSRSGPTGGS